MFKPHRLVWGARVATGLIAIAVVTGAWVVKGESLSCFKCDNGLTSGCLPDEHKDYFWFGENNWQGGPMHDQCTNPQHCGLYHSYYSGELAGHPFGTAYPVKLVREVREAVVAGDAQALERLIKENNRLQFNRQRRAIQLEGDNGTILLHLPVDARVASGLTSGLPIGAN